MRLFKSKEERRIERNIQIQKTLGLFAAQIKKLKGQQEAYIAAAREARRVNAPQQCELAKKALKQTLGQRRRLEHQLLTLRIATQMKEQAETHAEFAKALRAVSKTIGAMFGAADMVRTQRDFEVAMAKAQSMEQRIDLFLASSAPVLAGEGTGEEEVVKDEEIESLIAAEAAHAERAADADIDRGLKEVRDALEKGG
ncbi:MAG: hypothetical protein HY721_22320 [Planctomycetes bacterium]|nr:hypothetical protein [Planctomycetota bacterium]